MYFILCSHRAHYARAVHIMFAPCTLCSHRAHYL